jgi:hypothetical protein
MYGMRVVVSADALMLAASINITEEKLTEEELEKYRQGRVRSAIAQ